MSKKRLHVTSAHVNGYVVELTMSDDSIIERDFTFVDGPAFKKWRRDPNGIDRRVRMWNGLLVWPGDIDFDLDVVVWGGSRTRKRPIKRALVSYGGTLIPAPWVNEI
jgi:hypothetical protein